MKEIRQDLFAKFPMLSARVITTNLDVNKQGKAVMGRGVALQAARRWPSLRYALGDQLSGAFGIKVNHNVSAIYPIEGVWIVSFPVKVHWNELARPELIVKSAKQLVQLADKMKWQYVALPRPGCGNGGLKWELVKPMIEGILDDRFYVCNLEGLNDNPDSPKLVKVAT